MDAGIEPLAGDSNRQQTRKMWTVDAGIEPLAGDSNRQQTRKMWTVDAGIEPLAGDSYRQQTRKISGQWMQELSLLQETLTDSRHGKLADSGCRN